MNNKLLTQFRQFNFAFDPNWEEKKVFQKFKKVMKSDIIYYKYKINLRDLMNSRNFSSFISKKHEIQHSSDNLPMFWFLGEQIYSLYKQKYASTDQAIYYRCVWTVEIDNEKGIEKIINLVFYDYEYEKTILDVY